MADIEIDSRYEVDEVVRVPEDMVAVDLHESYQHGNRLEYGDEYVLCMLDGVNYLICWGEMSGNIGE